MGLDLNIRRETIVAQNEILLNTQGMIVKVGGVTLDGGAFGNVTVKAGTAVMMDGATGLAVPYADNAGAFPAGAEVYITASDAVIKDGNNNVVGVYVKAYLNTSKLTGVTDAFRTATNGRYIFG